MWQRIQTLYLAVSSILIGVLFFSVLATAIGTDGQTVNINFTEKIPYLCLMISIFVANVSALVTFKHRGLQIRVAVIATLLLLGFQVWIAVDYFTAESGIVFKYTAIFPLVAAILDILAVRGIFSDIMLAQSVNRLRTNRKNRKRS